MAGTGGHRTGAGRKPDAEARKLRADLKHRLPSALNAIDAIMANPEHPQHVNIAKWLVDKTAANLKAVSAPVEFELVGDSPADQARSVIKATSEGILSPSVAAELLGAVANCLKIIEVDEIESRLTSIESNISTRNNYVVAAPRHLGEH